MTTAIELARYIVNKCVIDSQPITNLQLQKILYCIQREHLRLYGVRLFKDPIEAWQFGPSVPGVYYEFCYFGAMSIESRYKNAADIDRKCLDTVDRIVEQKRVLAPWDLADDVNKSGGAWDVTYNGGRGNRLVITIDLIKERG